MDEGYVSTDRMKARSHSAADLDRRQIDLVDGASICRDQIPNESDGRIFIEGDDEDSVRREIIERGQERWMWHHERPDDPGACH
jgi:hypothetical protein